MEPTIIHIPERLLVGIRIQTTLAAQQTLALWQQFKPRIKEILHRANPDFYSVEVYNAPLDPNYFAPTTSFEKWAAVEVTTLETIPDGMESLLLPSGKYAVFIHHGPAHTFPKTAQYIFGTWLPNAPYQLDHRPHFEIMTPQYLPNDVNAEEEVWVPVRGRG